MQANYPKMQLVDIRYGQNKPAESFSAAQDLINKFPGQLDAISTRPMGFAQATQSHSPDACSGNGWMPLGNRFLLWQDRVERDARHHDGLVPFRVCVHRTAALHFL